MLHTLLLCGYKFRSFYKSSREVVNNKINTTLIYIYHPKPQNLIGRCIITEIRIDHRVAQNKPAMSLSALKHHPQRILKDALQSIQKLCGAYSINNAMITG